jgi:hypothetical protein
MDRSQYDQTRRDDIGLCGAGHFFIQDFAKSGAQGPGISGSALAHSAYAGRAKEGSDLTEFIHGVLFDAEESPLVRLGAARSFMERAALEESSNKRHVICGLIDKMDAIDSSVALSELRKATIIGNHNPVPAGWYDDVEPLVQKGLEMARAGRAGDVEQGERRLKDIETKRKLLSAPRGAQL